MEQTNAIIKSTFLGIEDHGLLTAFLYLDYGGAGQGFGGYRLDGGGPKSKGNVCGMFLKRCLEIADVTSWADLPGKTIRVEFDHSKIHRIGHIVEDEWFDPVAEFEAMP